MIDDCADDDADDSIYAPEPTGPLDYSTAGIKPKPLSEEHAELLKKSGISAEVIVQRGYETLDGTDGVMKLQVLGFSERQSGRARVPGLLIPLCDLTGRGEGAFQYRPDTPRMKTGPNGGKPIKYETPPGQQAVLDIPPAAREAVFSRSVPLIVTEGVRKADAAVSAGHAAVALLGVGSWRLPDWEPIPLTDRPVWIIFDSDAGSKKEVATQQAKLAKFLRGRGAHVGICAIPPGEDGAKVGLDDYIAAGDEVEWLFAEADDATAVPAAAPKGDPRPPLGIVNEADLFDHLHSTLGTGPLSGLFLRGGLLVRVPQIGEDGYSPPANETNDDGPAQVQRVDSRTLRALLQKSYWTYKYVTRDGVDVATHWAPGGGACDSAVALAGDSPALPRLRGVIHTPVVRRDWSVLDEPGYDPETRLLYLPNGLEVPNVPSRPLPRQRNAARDRLLYMLQDFPFASDSDRANYFGALLTPLLRVVSPGPWPLVVLSAPMQGSGKSLLARVARVIHGGVFRSEFPGDEDELRKAITAVLLTTTGPVIQFDNATKTLRSGNLTALLTSSEWSDRVLGGSTSATLPNDRLWLVTGNNVALGGDLPRRALWSVIDPKRSRPWERSDLAEPDLISYVTANRGRIIADLLTLVRSWVAAGANPAPVPRSDSYGEWASRVAGILTHAKVPGRFLDPATDRTPVGADDADWGEFLAAIHAEFGDERFRVSEVAERVRSFGGSITRGSGSVTRAALTDALPAELAEKVDRVGFSKSLGRWFKNRDGRYAGPYVVRDSGVDPTTNTATWRVLRE
jgi:hypothetical protein